MSGEIRYSFTEGEPANFFPQEIMFRFAEWAAEDSADWVYRADLGKWHSWDDIEVFKTTEELFQIFKDEKLRQ